VLDLNQLKREPNRTQQHRDPHTITGIVSPTFSSQKCLRIMFLIFLQNHVGIAKNFDQDKKHCFLSKSGTLFIKLDHLKFIGRTKRGGRDKQFPPSVLCFSMTHLLLATEPYLHI
jgi:hypothetical protein